jgi:hypothetical protein
MNRRIAILFVMISITTVAIVFTALTATSSSDRLLARAEIAKNSTITSAAGNTTNTTNATSSSGGNASTSAGSSHIYRGGGGAGVGGE